MIKRKRTFSLPPDVDVALTRQAKAEDRPVSRVIVRALRRYFDAETKAAPAPTRSEEG